MLKINQRHLDYCWIFHFIWLKKEISFQISKKSGRSNGFIERVVSQANQVSKAIKNNTAFSDGTVSVSYSVAKQVANIMKAQGLRKVCVIGLGKIGHGTLRYLKQQVPEAEIILVNRDEQKLGELLLQARNGDAREMLKDQCWIILNSNEFIFNH